MTGTASKIHVAARFWQAARRAGPAIALLLPTCLLLVACASAPPPRDALAAAESALARAESARAADFAPVDIDFARRQLDAAGAAFAEGDYDRARRMALQAELNAELAAAKSRAASARAEVQRRSSENAALRRDLLGEEGMQ